MNFWSFTDSDHITIQGQGTLDGRGYMWWIREWLQKNGKGGRPFVLYFARSRDIEVSGILIKNSAYYNFVLYDCENAYIHDMEIFVDVMG
jgi:polygalacturonase